VKPKTVTIMLAAASMGLAACGGSAKKSTTTTAVAAVTPAATVSTATSPTSHKAPPAKRHKPPAKPHATPPRSHPSPAPTAVVDPAPTGHVTGPYPDTCLTQAGLVDAHAFERDIWEAHDPLAPVKKVFVEGPYKTSAMASGSTQSLLGVEIADQAGLYVVSAVLTSHMDATVSQVAGCLKTATGAGTIQF
jgi:hypothetical protein